MKCNECNNANICLDHIEFPSLNGCTSGTPDRKVITNADRIRNMSDEELASVLFDSCIESMNLEECPCSGEESDNNKIREKCKKCILEWLQSEAE